MSDDLTGLTFEDALVELEQTVAQLESGNLTLELSLIHISRSASDSGRTRS